MSRHRIIAAHLVNDLSGSPFVFSQALSELQGAGYEIHLFTSSLSGYGFLSGIDGVVSHNIFYMWSGNKFLTFCCYFLNQLILFARLLIFLRAGDIVYVNSMLPFGAALAGRMRGCAVMYHIHEVSIRPEILKRFLLAMVQYLADECIYVSQYTRSHTDLSVPGRVIYNALPEKFSEAAFLQNNIPSPFTVLMACSLRIYKGVNIFVACARRMPAIKFELVLNASQAQIDGYFRHIIVPENLSLYPAQQNMHAFYSRASVVVNLSLPNQWVETFGMTILEAMQYQRPVIVPSCGGITELVRDGVNGFCIDSRDRDKLVSALEALSSDSVLYQAMREAASEAASRFSHPSFRASILDTAAGMLKLHAAHGAAVYTPFTFKKKLL